MNRTVALVPVKPLATAKSRLALGLSGAQRATVYVRLLAGVLAALAAASRVEARWVIGGDSHARGLASDHGAIRLPELGRDLNETLARALECLPEAVTGALVLPMDLPFLTGDVVDAMLGMATKRRADVAIAPDRWERGTNALLLTRPFVLQPAFGPGSFALHARAAELQGLRVAIYRHPALAFDLDTPADLAECGAHVGSQERLTWRRS